MSASILMLLFILLVLVLAGLVVVIAVWLREGGIFPGERSERIHREILTEIDARLDRFEQIVREAERLEAGLAQAAIQSKRIIDLVNATKLIGAVKDSLADSTFASKSGIESDNSSSEQNPASDSGLPEIPLESQSNLSATSVGAGTEGRLSEETKQKALELAEIGLSAAEIAKRLNLGTAEVELLIRFSK